MKYKTLILTAIFLLTAIQIAFAQTTPSPEMSAANKLIQEKKWQEAEKAFAGIIEKEPGNARAWFFLGFARHSQNKWEEAIKAFKKNVEIAQVPAGMYNIAAGFSRLNKKDEAFEWLEKALNNGAALGTNIETDEDFENIKGDARFKKMRLIVEQKRNPCMFSDEAKQFDFWIGEWEVFVGGNKVGENKITKEVKGCTLVESWSGQNGNRGKSLNAYNPATKKWKQFYVGSGGGVLEFEGELEGGVLYLEGESTGQTGGKILHKLDFHNLPDKTVRQHWQQSYDGGKTWNTVWDSIYKKKETSAKDN